MNIDPIGYFTSSQKERYSVPRQSTLSQSNFGKIILEPHCNYEQALEDLDGFDRIWVIFCFHRNKTWKPKVLPPRGGKKRGLFATRSPHRPNPIGLSCVELLEIKGREIFIKHHDLIDASPILDIKPYINYADSFTSERQGWLEELELQERFSISWSARATVQRNFLEGEHGVSIEENIAPRLEINPFPYENNRVKELEASFGKYEMAFKTWRVHYEVFPERHEIIVFEILSGYSHEVISGKEPSRWDDVAIHRAFLENEKKWEGG
jgi:tRNA (adenine37-N6)-methyltransferase